MAERAVYRYAQREEREQCRFSCHSRNITESNCWFTKIMQ
jgi:hypothetical protein